METLVVVSQQQRRVKSHSHHHHLASPPPSRGFRGISCRTFHSGILSSPPPPPPPPPTTRQEPKTPPVYSYSEPPPLKHHSKRSRPISITPGKPELFAGPVFSNSPPPSSLPIPKFSLRQKRSISLELPMVGKTDVEVLPHAKSAPSSPTRARLADFGVDTAVATENLRRILHLDISDDD